MKPSHSFFRDPIGLGVDVKIKAYWDPGYFEPKDKYLREVETDMPLEEKIKAWKSKHGLKGLL